MVGHFPPNPRKRGKSHHQHHTKSPRTDRLVTSDTNVMVTTVRAARVCPANMTYLQCGPSCRKQCGKYLSAYINEECDDCVPGCHCDSGLLYDKGQCLAPDQCQCLYAGNVYTQGQTIKTEDQCQSW